MNILQSLSHLKAPRVFLSAIAALSLAMSPISLAPAQAAADEAANKSKAIKIGCMIELSGAAANVGDELVKGVKLYLKQINNTMAGRRVELIVENDESSAATAKQKAVKLIQQDKVDVLNGLILGNIGYAVAPVADKFQTPLVISICGSDDLTQRKRSDWVVRSSFSASQPMYPFADYVYNTLHYKRVVTVGLDYSFGWEVVGGFQKSFEQAGGKVVQKLWAPLGFLDFTDVLKQVKKDADAVFICTACIWQIKCDQLWQTKTEQARVA